MPPTTAQPSKNRWVGLVFLSAGLMIVILDQTVLNVALPSILREFNTSLSSLQWVISGYSLIFASLLITFGRLGDLYGRRRMFILGALFFAIGSYLASISHSATSLFVGEALIEGIGAAMMLPSTLSIISSSFFGRERGIAFAVWGAVAGSAGAFGPIVGGYLTTYHSWRWAFRINVIVAPLAILGVLLFVSESRDTRDQQRLDIPGIIMASLGLFALVFALIEASAYGWYKPLQPFTVLGWTWPFATSIIFASLLAAFGLLAIFYVIETYKERHNLSPLFAFGLFKTKSFFYGLVTTLILSMGEFGLVFILPIFLQVSKDLSAIKTGLWTLPLGLAAIIGAAIAGGLSRRFGPKWLVSIGMVLEAIGILYAAQLLTAGLSFGQLAIGLTIYGLGVGFATAQLTNVSLHDIPPEKAGEASGMTSTIRQVGSALGIAVIGAVLASQIASQGKSLIQTNPDIPDQAKPSIIAQFGHQGDTLAPPKPTNPRQTAIGDTLTGIVKDATATAAHNAGLLAGAAVLIGSLLSLAIPNIPPDDAGGPETITSTETAYESSPQA